LTGHWLGRHHGTSKSDSTHARQQRLLRRERGPPGGDENWSDDRQWWLASIAQHWFSNMILPKIAADVAAKCKKICARLAAHALEA
jgi:hypothetical protein